MLTEHQFSEHGHVLYALSGWPDEVCQRVADLYAAYDPAGYGTRLTKFVLLSRDEVQATVARRASC